MIKLFKPYVNNKAIENVTRVLQSGQLAEGPEVVSFEKEFSRKFTKANVVAVNSGTSALALAYELAGIQKGDEVITPVLTCTATNLPLVHIGAKIVFADVSDDLNIDIEDVKRKITKNTKAIVFVHFGGNNRGLRQLVGICREKKIILIEDAAQAVGSEYWGKADFTAVSLQAIKILTSGDGGFLICKKTSDYKRAKKLRWFGYDREKKQQLGDIDLDEAGYKYHMNDISAAIGLGNLQDIDKLIAHRKKLAKIYESYGLFSHMWLAGGFTQNYKKLKQELLASWYEIGQHHYRNDKYTVFKKYKTKCPNMDKIENTYFFVPFHHEVLEEHAHAIGKIYKKYI